LNSIELGNARNKKLLTTDLINKAWIEAKTKYVINKGCMTQDDIDTYDEMKIKSKVLKEELK